MDYIKSPMNYTGGKYKLIPQIMPLFPKKTGKFMDLFTGGMDVGINMEAGEIFCNDSCSPIIILYQTLKEIGADAAVGEIKSRIDRYSLSMQNADGYLSLRKDYNEGKNPLDLFALVCYSFNHSIRFNQKGMFNVPFGRERSKYNATIEKNLIQFCHALQDKDIHLLSLDFRKVDFSSFSEGDFVYADPPYLISDANYNLGWGEAEEKSLLSILDRLNDAGIKFALSNVVQHKGEKNEILMEWMKKYHVHNLSMKYSNCNYHLKDKESASMEVLVTNYS